MQVPQLLLDTLEDQCDDYFKRFVWYLTTCNDLLDGCSPIRKARLQNPSREDAVTEMINSYGEESAVKVTAVILRKIGNNNSAANLEKSYAATPSTSSSVAAPPVAAPPVAAPPVAAISAQNGSVIIAPSVTGGTSGAWNITINK
ncbi:hypothetical protein PAMA_016676 [Pampus argenteus]